MTRAGARALWPAWVLALVLFGLLHVSWFDFLHGDEAFFAKIARNIRSDPVNLLVGASDPSPPADARDGDRLASTTPFFPAVLAPLQGAGAGPRALRLPTLLAWIATALSAGWIARRIAGPVAGAATALLLLASPGNVLNFATAVPDPLLAGLAWAALALALRGLDRGSTALSLAAGVLWGLAFLTKLWLVGQVLLAWAFVLALRALRPPRAPALRAAAYSALGFAPVASAHLLAVTLATPDLVDWALRDVYVGFSAGKFTGAGYSAGDWLHPWYYYPGVIVRDHWPALLLTVPGVRLLVDSGRMARETAAALAGAFLLSVGLLSAVAAKHALYVLPAAPTLYVFAGAGVAALLEGGRAGAAPRGWAIAAAGALAAVTAVVWLLGLRRDELPLFTVVAIAGAALLVLGAARRRAGSNGLTATCLLGVALLGAADEVRRGIARRALPYGQAAAAAAPWVAAARDSPAFAANNLYPFEYYLGRKGVYLRNLTEAEWPRAQRRFLEGSLPVMIYQVGRRPGPLDDGGRAIHRGDGRTIWMRERAGLVVTSGLEPLVVFVSPSATRDIPP